MKNPAENLLRRSRSVLKNLSAVARQQELADEARDARRYEQAAALYREVARMAAVPEVAAGLWGQAGNCAKDAGLFADAAQAYAEALQIYAAVPAAERWRSWEAGKADLALQLGHLWKLSGNFSASKRAYIGAASLGSPHARQEIDAFANVSSKVMIFNAKSTGTVPAIAFEKVAAAELRPRDPATLREAARQILEWGQSVPLARAYGTLAFLVDKATQARPAHMSFASQMMVWPPESIVMGATAVARAGGDTRARLRTLIVHATHLNTPFENTWAGPTSPGSTTAQPSEEEFRALSDRLCSAIDTIYEAVWTCRQDTAAAVTPALTQLKEALDQPVSYVTFCAERSPAELRLTAVRVLLELVRGWLAVLTFNNSFDPLPLLELGASSGVSAVLQERRRELGSLRALFIEVDSILYGLVESNEQRDTAMAVLLACNATLVTPAEARELLSMRYGSKFTRILHAIIHQTTSRSNQTTQDIVSSAQGMKDNGLLHEAFSAVRDLDEETASVEQLTEKALIAKAVGEFETAVRLLERCYQTRRDNFMRNELAMVLPEVRPIPDIIKGYGADAEFLDVARNHAAFRLALGGATQLDHPTTGLAPEIAPEHAALRSFAQAQSSDRDSITVLGLGGGERDTPLGRLRVLRPVDFVRVRVASREPIVRLRVRLDGRTVTESHGVLQLEHTGDSSLDRQVFNAWFETSHLAHGPHTLQLYFEEQHGGYRTHEQTVWIDDTDWSVAASVSPAVVLEAPGEGTLEERVAHLPSVPFDAERSYFQGKLDRILVIRADQLGDTTMSLAAAAELKRRFPGSQIDALVSPGQVELVRGSGIFENVYSVNLPYDQLVRMRLIGLESQRKLRDELAERHYDLAIDLCPGSHSRPLLKLTGARYTAGFKPHEFPWLSFAIDVRTTDPGNRLEAMCHSRAPQVLVEALDVAAHAKPLRLPKAPLSLECRKKLGLGETEPFALFHTGARTASRKWPLANFVEVARRLHRETKLRVVLMLDHPHELEESSLDADSGIIILRGHPTFAEFDGLVSNCSVLLGNDSGPKHLAALRATPVVSIHMGAVNWAEWGQDGIGVIVTRRVPCYGCGIELNEECGRNLPCLHDISTDDVFSALLGQLNVKPQDEAPATPAASAETEAEAEALEEDHPA